MKDKFTSLINKIISFLDKTNLINCEQISDNDHTFTFTFNEWAKTGEVEVYKSKRHFTGEECFDGSWFVVVALTPYGQISNHYKPEDWDVFKVPEYEKSKYEYDGSTPHDCLIRMKKIINRKED